jgi:hypothetical protein
MDETFNAYVQKAGLRRRLRHFELLLRLDSEATVVAGAVDLLA